MRIFCWKKVVISATASRTPVGLRRMGLRLQNPVLQPRSVVQHFVECVSM